VKVYVGQLGAREFLVAAENRAEALEAFGATDDLFDAGHAAEAMDPELTAVAMQNPGVVYERPVWAWRKHYECGLRSPTAASPSVAIPVARRAQGG